MIRKGNGILLFGKGKQYSNVAKESEHNFRKWLLCSQLTEQSFFEKVAKEDTYFAIHSNTEEATISVCNDMGIVGLPFVWEKDSGIDYNSFLIDTALLFCFIAGRTEDKQIEKKITDFVKEKIWKGVR